LEARGHFKIPPPIPIASDFVETRNPRRLIQDAGINQQPAAILKRDRLRAAAEKRRIGVALRGKIMVALSTVMPPLCVFTNSAAAFVFPSVTTPVPPLP